MASTVDRRSVLAAGAMFAGSISLACLGGAPVARARDRGILTFGLSGYPPGFNAWAQSGTAAGTVKLLVHRGLLSYGPDGNLRGELAESWRVDEDGAWTFRLRDAAFQDGKPVTSADVRWNIEQVAAGDSTAYLRGQFRRISSIETPDDRTVRLRTAEPVATLPNWFAHFNMPIIPKGADPDGLIGAGPFRVKGKERGVAIDLAAWAGYYKPGLPRLKGIRAVVYADEHLRVAALEAGDVDLIEFVPWQSMRRIREDPGLKLDTVDGPFMYLTFNGTRPPFDDPRVRKAVAHAVKRDDIVAAAFYERGSGLAHLPIAEASEFYNPGLADGWAYDPALARRLLADAGHAGGLSCRLLATAQYRMHQSTAEIVQFHLAQVGIDATLELTDWPTRVRLGNVGHYDLAVMGTTADSNDPDGLSDVLDGTLPPSFTRSAGIAIPAVDEALAAGRAAFDTVRRKRIYRRMEAAAIETAPIVGLTWRSQGYAMRNVVQGFVNMPGQLTTYSGITLEQTVLA